MKRALLRLVLLMTFASPASQFAVVPGKRPTRFAHQCVSCKRCESSDLDAYRHLIAKLPFPVSEQESLVNTLHARSDVTLESVRSRAGQARYLLSAPTCAQESGDSWVATPGEMQLVRDSLIKQPAYFSQQFRIVHETPHLLVCEKPWDTQIQTPSAQKLRFPEECTLLGARL